MKPLEKHELYENLTGFLKTKGIELKEGSYAQAIQKSCSLLTDAINLGQEGLEKAKNKIDNKLDQVRQVIHEKTAPKSASSPATPASDSAGTKESALKSAARKPRARKPKSSSS
jgi:hypothetical protein